MTIPRVKYRGQGVGTPEVQVPGWAGAETNNSYQPWHMLPFVEFAKTGIEITYTGPSVAVTWKEVPDPFTEVSSLFFAWQTDLAFKIPDAHSLVVLPHYRFYTDPTWETPCPVACAVQYDWWPQEMSILFKRPDKNETLFKTGDPIAQAIIVPRKDYELVEMEEVEKTKQQAAARKIEDERERFVTREWITNSGLCQDNLYSVLARLEKQRQLPQEVKEYRRHRIFKR